MIILFIVFGSWDILDVSAGILSTFQQKKVWSFISLPWWPPIWYSSLCSLHCCCLENDKNDGYYEIYWRINFPFYHWRSKSANIYIELLHKVTFIEQPETDWFFNDSPFHFPLEKTKSSNQPSQAWKFFPLKNTMNVFSLWKILTEEKVF